MCVFFPLFPYPFVPINVTVLASGHGAKVLHAVATMAQEFLADEARVAPRALLETAVDLHGIVLSLQGLQGIALQGVIAKVCVLF